MTEQKARKIAESTLINSFSVQRSLYSGTRTSLVSITGWTPGHFKVVYQKNVFNEKKPSSEFLKELENEVSYNNTFRKKVGPS